MMISSLVLALAAATPASPLSNPIHLHPRVKTVDDRITFVLANDNASFRDVKIAGRSYTLNGHAVLTVKAPAGTMIYSDSRGLTHKRGDVLLEVTPSDSHARITLD